VVKLKRGSDFSSPHPEELPAAYRSKNYNNFTSYRHDVLSCTASSAKCGREAQDEHWIGSDVPGWAAGPGSDKTFAFPGLGLWSCIARALVPIAARPGTRGPAPHSRLIRRKEIDMDKSVYQARWLLLPVLTLCLGFLMLGAMLS
jgi:hypothetical protein